MTRPGISGRHRIAGALLAHLALVGFMSPCAIAEPLSGGAGVDYSSAPNGQTTKDALGFLTLVLGRFDGTAVGARYEDTLVGNGLSGALNLGLPVAKTMFVRAIGTRFLGDETYRAWRLKAGPQVVLPMGQTVGLSYVRFEDNAGGISNSVVGELKIPRGERLSAQAGVTYGSLPGAMTNLQGTLGLNWIVAKHLLFMSELGAGENVTTISTSTGGVGIGRGGSGKRPQRSGGSGTQNQFAATAYFGLRVLVP
jgi:hypothetical protein